MLQSIVFVLFFGNSHTDETRHNLTVKQQMLLLKIAVYP